MAPARKRADILLVERGLFESRARAQAAIEAGLVMANGKPVAKPSETIALDAELQAQPAHPFVSRGGVKLAGALEQYPIDIEGHVCLDVGASTGGFTEVLLANGANLVFSIDVGREQLHPSLRGHPKVVSMEETDIRDFEIARISYNKGFRLQRFLGILLVFEDAKTETISNREPMLAVQFGSGGREKRVGRRLIQLWGSISRRCSFRSPR